MIFIRSFLFLISFYLCMTFFTLLSLPALILPRNVMRQISHYWLGSCVYLAKYIAGINYEIRGSENIPDGPAIFAAKHQSAWETVAMHFFHFDAPYVLKKELLSIPVFGWCLTKMNCIAVDRNAGASALKLMVKQAKEVLAMKRSIIIFPQGTRTSPGEEVDYHPGIAGIYTQVDSVVVPVALNSGQFWGRNAFKKTPGTIIVEYLEPIPSGLKRREFMSLLKERIETANKRIEAETTAKRGY